MEIEHKVLKRIVPTKIEREKLNAFINELLRVAKTISGLDSVICGSIGKQTWLRGDHDIDLFLLFPKYIKKHVLEKHSLLYGKKIVKEFRGKYEISYAEHPYVRGYIGKYKVDIVPCYRIKKNEKIISSVDRSVLHLEYILEHLRPEQRNEVRLLKQFMKGIGVYGSDAKHLGFSGYVCELLILKYGTFKHTINEISNWLIPCRISLEGKVKHAFKEPLVILDPIDEKRNAAAIVSSENLFKLICYAKKYISSPSMSFFFPKDKFLNLNNVNELKKRGSKFLALVFDVPDIIDDVLYPQMRKLCRRLETLLKSEDFMPLHIFFCIDDKVYVIIELETWHMPNIKQMKGPVVFAKKNVYDFIKKYQGNFIFFKNHILYADKYRYFIDAVEFFKNILSKGSEELASLGIPKNLISVFKKSKIVEHKEFWKLVQKSKSLNKKLKDMYFEIPEIVTWYVK